MHILIKSEKKIILISIFNCYLFQSKFLSGYKVASADKPFAVIHMHNLFYFIKLIAKIIGAKKIKSKQLFI